MGRIMSFGQDGRMVRDFDKSEHDFMRRYGKTPEEVMVENAKLLDGHSWERRAVRVNVSNKQSDYATGHSECSACGCHVSPIARYCEGCGARFIEKEDEQ